MNTDTERNLRSMDYFDGRRQVPPGEVMERICACRWSWPRGTCFGGEHRCYRDSGHGGACECVCGVTTPPTPQEEP